MGLSLLYYANLESKHYIRFLFKCSQFKNEWYILRRILIFSESPLSVSVESLSNSFRVHLILKKTSKAVYHGKMQHLQMIFSFSHFCPMVKISAVAERY